MPLLQGRVAERGNIRELPRAPIIIRRRRPGGLIGIYLAEHGDILLMHLPLGEFVLVRAQLAQLAHEGLAAACLRATAPPVAETMPPK